MVAVRLLIVLITLFITTTEGINLLPSIIPAGVKIYNGTESNGGYYRELFVDTAAGMLYVGARNYIYKVKIGSYGSQTNVTMSSLQVDDNLDVGAAATFDDSATSKLYWTTVDSSSLSPALLTLLAKYNITSSATVGYYPYYLNSLTLKQKLQQPSLSFLYSGKQYGNNLLDVAEEYSSIFHTGIAPSVTFRKMCESQLQILRQFYGDSLQIPLDQGADVICARHVRGLLWLDSGRSRLFGLATGIFGTMPTSVTGTNDYSSWADMEASYTTFINCFDPNYNSLPWLSCKSKLRPPFYAPYNTSSGRRANFTSSPTIAELTFLNSSGGYSYVLPSPENFIGKKRLCDPKPAPRRLIVTSDNFSVFASDPLQASARDSCPKFLMSSSFLAGYHPDQATLTYVSDSGNGPSRTRAIYVLAEIGQEKQLDLNLDYLNLPELMPLTGSASLAVVRLLVNPATNDVDPSSILTSNPFKYTWVTSNLNRWGKMLKTGSQEQVPHRPRAVGLFEDGAYMYFFFREVEWERLPLPAYNVTRYHYQLNSYSRALYYPWEAAFAANRTQPYMKQEEVPGQTREELYAPPLIGWEHVRRHAQMTGRVARVCKNDQGLPMGVQDASVFDLDHGLSLWNFQSFVKARLTCMVPIGATPQIWRFRKDEWRNSDRGPCNETLLTANDLYGRDLHYRSVPSNESVTYVFNQGGSADTSYAKYYYLSHCRSYKWAWLPQPVIRSAAYVEYSELRDMFRIGNTFYGVFGSHLSEEQQNLASQSGSPYEAMLGSAVCTFTLDDISKVFNGPFKKRVANAWRAYDPRLEGDPVTPSPYSCDADPVISAAQKLMNMNIEFLDPTQPTSEELWKFDLRGNSSRLDFFENDVEGSRTMWQDVNGTAVLSRSGVLFEKIVADTVSIYTVLFVSTSDGEVYKISTWQANQSCWTSSSDGAKIWLNSTYMQDIWNNPMYPMYNRTVSSAGGSAAASDISQLSFASDLTMEKYLNFPGDFVFTSDWNCTPAVRSQVLAVLKPFQGAAQKIWSMKLYNRLLLLGTDTGVLQVPVEQCEQYAHCATCAADPYCWWDISTAACLVRANTSSSANSSASNISSPWIADPTAQCKGCQTIVRSAAINEDVILAGFSDGNSAVPSSLAWFFNGSLLPLQIGKLMTSDNSSLIIFNFNSQLNGIYELREVSSSTCLVQYSVTLAGCQDELCQYRKKYADWCLEYDKFRGTFLTWYSDYSSSGCGAVKP